VPPRCRDLLTVLSTADRDGLRPGLYLAQLEARFQESDRSDLPERRGRSTAWSISSCLCTRGVSAVWSHAMSGRLHPTGGAGVVRNGRRHHRSRSPPAATRSPEHDCRIVTQSPAATSHVYWPSGSARSYRRLAAQGGWPMVPPGPTVHQGEQAHAIAAVRARLLAEGRCLGSEPRPMPHLFDTNASRRPVRRFQQRHGFTPDGRSTRRW